VLNNNHLFTHLSKQFFHLTTNNTVKPVLCDLPSEIWSHKTGGHLIQV